MDATQIAIANPKGGAEDSSTYQVDGKVFIVTPVFRDEASETLGDILLKLMKTENVF